MPRFYIRPEFWDSNNLILCKSESHHCLNVLRLKEGDKVSAFNGQGEEVHTEIQIATKGQVQLKESQPTHSIKPKAKIALGQAIPKGKNMDLIIEKATELGISEIYPIISDRSIVRISSDELVKKQEKWQRVATEACKQSGQNWLPEVQIPKKPEELFQSDQLKYDLLLIASLQKESKHLKEILSEYQDAHQKTRPNSVLILIGPEGDFTPSEINVALNIGCSPMNLGPIVLRSETAALYSLSVLSYELL
jgi:16S rRNA (uracil1498-N3)-methyltransferase